MAKRATKSTSQPEKAQETHSDTSVLNIEGIIPTIQGEDTNRTQQITFYLSLVRDLVRDLARDLDSDHARTHNLARIRDLARVRDFDHAGVSDLVRDLANALGYLLDDGPYFVVDEDTGSVKFNTDIRFGDSIDNLEDVEFFLFSLHTAFKYNPSYALNLAFGIDDSLARAYADASKHDLVLWINIGRLIIKSIILLIEIAVKLTPSHFTLTLGDTQNVVIGFSTDYVVETITPFIAAITQIQHVIDEIEGRPRSDISTLAIRIGSIVIDVTGGIRETVQLMMNVIIPWRRENEKRLKELTVEEKELELKQKEVDVEQARAELAQEKAQGDDQTRLLQTQVHKQELENQKTQLEVIKLALDMIDQISPNLSQEQRLLFAMKIVDPIHHLASSPLELLDVAFVDNDSPTLTAPGQDGEKAKESSTQKKGEE